MTIVCVDVDGYGHLPVISSLIIASDQLSEIIAVSDESASLRAIDECSDLEILISNAPLRAVFAKVRDKFPEAHTILVTEFPMKNYSAELDGQEHILLDHVIANRTTNDWVSYELVTTIKKILSSDKFGLSHYLDPLAEIKEIAITGSEDRNTHNNAVMQYAQSHNVGHHLGKMIFGISEELLMNAIYDAPVAGGHQDFDSTPRTSAVILPPEHQGTLQYGCDGRIFAISVSDPFGALKRDKLFQYLKKVLMPRDSTSLIDTKKGGAGLGIFKILYSSHALICNVHAHRKTEFISVIDIHEQLRDFSKFARSIHFFDSN
jgi:hypothetical protein